MLIWYSNLEKWKHFPTMAFQSFIKMKKSQTFCKNVFWKWLGKHIFTIFLSPGGMKTKKQKQTGPKLLRLWKNEWYIKLHLNDFKINAGRSLQKSPFHNEKVLTRLVVKENKVFIQFYSLQYLLNWRKI